VNIAIVWLEKTSNHHQHITIQNSNAIEAHKSMSLRSCSLLKNDFPLSINILKVNIAILWLETPSNNHQSLYIFIVGVKNV